MCMSPDKMSDDRLREAADYYRNAAQTELREDPTDSLGDARRWNAKADRFEALLAEREAQRATDIEEILTAVVAEQELVAI